MTLETKPFSEVPKGNFLTVNGTLYLKITEQADGNNVVNKDGDLGKLLPGDNCVDLSHAVVTP